MLGSAMEAEDIVQEAYLRYRATPPESIRTLKSFLTTIVHHLCLDHLKSAQAQRENYVGPWLPEPIVTGDGAALLSPLRQITDRVSIRSEERRVGKERRGVWTATLEIADRK